MDRRKQVEKALREGDALPAAPDVMMRIAELCKDPRASARDLGKVLQLDPALTTRVLKQVNSSFYGLSASIKTVTHAVVILGFQEIRHIALSVPVANLYEDNMDAPGIDVSGLWSKTVEVACFARTLSYHVRHEIPEQVFVSGILSNVGIVLLNSILGEEYADVYDACTQDEFLPEVEAAELGISHVDVARQLAEKWRFPGELITAITRHYHPVESDGTVLTEAGLIYAARRLRSTLREESPKEADSPRLQQPVIDAFQLTPDVVRECWTKAESEFESAKSMLLGG